MPNHAHIFVAILACAVPATSLRAGVGVVSHVKVLSDKVEDVSSLEAWRQAFIKPGMSEQEKALAVWKSAVAFRHQDIPPKEFLENEATVHDPIKSFNVYGYGMCSCASAQIEALSRYIGLYARGWGIANHSVPEVNIGGRWCMLDASLINYFTKPDGSIAGVEEISGNIAKWYAQHPDYQNNNDKLYQFMLNGGWHNGPEILSGGRYDGNGWLPAATHGWYSNMQEFGSGPKNFLYEYGSEIGYEVNIQLRPGERLVRNWSNLGLHVNMQDGPPPGVMSAVIGKDQLRYSPAFGDIAPGRIGNGTQEYDVPLGSGIFRDGALVAENLASHAEDGAGPAVHVVDPRKPGLLILRMPSSYVYLGGHLTLAPVVTSGGSVGLFFSENNGVDWKPVGEWTSSGIQQIDLKPLIFRRYDYRLKFVMNGNATGLDTIHIVQDIQHSQRPLPALGQGTNRIHFSAGAQEGTITVEGSINPDAKGKQVLLTDFHPQLQGIEAADMRLIGGTGQITVPIETPGDMTRLRLGCHYRARDVKDGWDIQASFDGGKQWSPVGKLNGAHAGFSTYIVFNKIPAGTRAALVRFAGTQRNTTLLLGLRISADYREPHGGFAPVKVTYVWDESGQPRQDIHTANTPEDTYAIVCKDKPLMKSITLELAR